MRYVCQSCLKEHAVAEGEAWPVSCECGGTLFKESVSLTYLSTGTIDPVTASNSVLRQPGSPNVHPPI